MQIGIVGLPYSGKTSLFEAITGAHGTALEHSGLTHSATVRVPDERLDRLAERGHPKKITHALIDFVDVAGIAGETGHERSVSVLSSIRDADGLVNVVRFFESPSAPPHPRGSLDPIRDVNDLQAELIVSDLAVVETRIEKLQKQVKKSTPTLEQDRKELAILERLREALDGGKRVADAGLSHEESLLLRSFSFLSERPMIHVLNVHEDQIESDAALKMAELLGPNTIVISARIEKEIAELDAEEQADFIAEMGLGDPAAKRVIRACYGALGLCSFFTGVDEGEELRAWTIHAGDDALTAAGKIHSDIARGFIRAEVMRYEDVLEFGGTKGCRANGKTRLEGKEYKVQDGDVTLFRFKV